MIKIEHVEAIGFDPALRGMRNPMNSWHLSDSDATNNVIGENDLKLAKQLAKAGTDHSKYLRMIPVYMDITAPLYWWKEFDTYKVGTVANSCSTMHKIHAKEFTLDDFSHDHLLPQWESVLMGTIEALNECRCAYVEKSATDKSAPDKKQLWWQMIQLLPSSYNQKRTVMLNYQALMNIHHARKTHKLDEWREFCRVVETLPYFKEIYLD